MNKGSKLKCQKCHQKKYQDVLKRKKFDCEKKELCVLNVFDQFDIQLQKSLNLVSFGFSEKYLKIQWKNYDTVSIVNFAQYLSWLYFLSSFLKKV